MLGGKTMVKVEQLLLTLCALFILSGSLFATEETSQGKEVAKASGFFGVTGFYDYEYVKGQQTSHTVSGAASASLEVGMWGCYAECTGAFERTRDASNVITDEAFDRKVFADVNYTFRPLRAYLIGKYETRESRDLLSRAEVGLGLGYIIVESESVYENISLIPFYAQEHYEGRDVARTFRLSFRNKLRFSKDPFSFSWVVFWRPIIAPLAPGNSFDRHEVDSTLQLGFSATEHIAFTLTSTLTWYINPEMDIDERDARFGLGLRYTL